MSAIIPVEFPKPRTPLADNVMLDWIETKGTVIITRNENEWIVILSAKCVWRRMATGATLREALDKAFTMGGLI